MGIVIARPTRERVIPNPSDIPRAGRRKTRDHSCEARARHRVAGDAGERSLTGNSVVEDPDSSVDRRREACIAVYRS